MKKVKYYPYVEGKALRYRHFTCSKIFKFKTTMIQKPLRYQVYGLDNNDKLDKPITIPMDRKETAIKYFNDCIQCALVSINEHGTIIEILAEKKAPIYDKKSKTKKNSNN